MLFGKISWGLIALAMATFGLMSVIQRGWGSPIAVLGGLTIVGCVPAALLVGAIGLFRDKSKWLAGSAAVVAGGLVGLWVMMIMR